MDTFSPYFGEEVNYMRSSDKEEEEDEEEEEEDKGGNGCKEIKEEEKDESASQKQQRPAWTPGLGFFSTTQKEVHYFVGEKIIIEEGFDSFAGMIWPGAVALCHYLDTHREQINLVDKAVLDIGAGTGLVSVVASLLGAWVTATDLPVVLSNLRLNLSRNTRGRCRHTPQVAALSWGYDLESTYPTSVYRYDYVLAADVVYHHDFLNELLVTMKHFCKPGTTVIWANKVRFESDLTFTENFKKAFHTSLLAEDGEMKIFMATCREEVEEGGEEVEDLVREEEESEETQDGEKEEKHDTELHCVDIEKSKGKENFSDTNEEPHISESERRDEKEREQEEKNESDEEEIEERIIIQDDSKEDEKDIPENNNSSCKVSGEHTTGQTLIHQTAVQLVGAPAWVPSNTSSFGRDIYHYAGQDIVIHESIDSFGAVMWPAALALCSFLDSNRQTVNMQEKEVLELGAGTGLVTIVASLLGASVTATDLPDVLSNLRANVMRNTRGRCRHTPQVAALSWGYDLESTYPTSVHRYDYVLAADVVYHHDFLNELLVTMRHFCKPGTTVIWANKVRFESDLTFTENFKKAFHTSLLAEDGEMKIFMATCREGDAQ